MARRQREMTDGVRLAFEAQAKERIKLVAGALLCLLGGLIGLLGIYGGRTSHEIGLPAGALIFGCGLLIYRTTALYKTVKKGPRVPRRIRLPFDSMVEISVAQAPVQSRSDMPVAGRPPDDQKANGEDTAPIEG